MELYYSPPPNSTRYPGTAQGNPAEILSLSFLNDLELFDDNFTSKEICAFTNKVHNEHFDHLDSCIIMPTISHPVSEIIIDILVDSGSTLNFISNSVVKKLHLKKCHLKVETEIHGMGSGKAQKASKCLNVNISNKDFSCYVLNKVCQNAPEVPIDLQNVVGDEYELEQNFPHPELKTDLILGLRFLFKLLVEKPIKIIRNSILLVPAIVWYLVLGPLAQESAKNTNSYQEDP